MNYELCFMNVKPVKVLYELTVFFVMVDHKCIGGSFSSVKDIPV